MPSYTDQTGRTVRFDQPPRRIVSLVPSLTELLFGLGLGDEVVGITKFCIHPDHWFRQKTRVGGTKRVNTVVIDRLHPDLIIASKEENVKDQVEELGGRYPVWVTDVKNLAEALQMIRDTGQLVDRGDEARRLAGQINEAFEGLAPPPIALRAAYLVWREPFMAAGGDTFIHSMLAAAGFINVFEDRKRYPVVSAEELNSARCQVLILPSEPFPFKEKHIPAIQRLLPQTTVTLADGELFSWYGSRLLKSAPYLARFRDQLLNLSPL